MIRLHNAVFLTLCLISKVAAEKEAIIYDHKYFQGNYLILFCFKALF